MRLKITFVFFHRSTGINIVIPAQAGIQYGAYMTLGFSYYDWIPAYAGMTNGKLLLTT